MWQSLAPLTRVLAVDIPSVVDVYHVNPILLYVYFVDDAVAATSSGTQAG